MKRALQILLGTALSFMFLFIGIGYARSTDTLAIEGKAIASTYDGVLIYNVDVISGDAVVNNYVGANLNSTVTLDPSDVNATTTLKVSLYNNSDISYVFDGVSYEREAYDNLDIDYSIDGFTVISKYGYLDVFLTFYYWNDRLAVNNVLNSLLNFNFVEFTGTSVNVVEGNSADVIGSIKDGRINYDGQNSKYRWTNWSADDHGRGDIVSMVVSWEEAKTFDAIKLYHFIDAGGCDFPHSIKMYYYDEELRAYVEITGYTELKNYENAARQADSVYAMTITELDDITEASEEEKTDVAFYYNYKGTAPRTTYVLNDQITTLGIKIVFDAIDDYYVGLLELELYLDGAKVKIE